MTDGRTESVCGHEDDETHGNTETHPDIKLHTVTCGAAGLLGSHLSFRQKHLDTCWINYHEMCY